MLIKEPTSMKLGKFLDGTKAHKKMQRRHWWD